MREKRFQLRPKDTKQDMRSKIRFLALLVLTFGVLELSGLAQCVMCGTALSSSPESQGLAASFRWGIALLMLMPYVILGSIGFAVYRAYRKRKAAREPVAETSAGWLGNPAPPRIPREISPN